MNPMIVDRFGMPISTDNSVANGDSENALHVSLTGSLIRNGGPILLDTIPFSRLNATPGTYIYNYYRQALLRSSSNRTLTIVNNTNQQITFTVSGFDSIITGSVNPTGGQPATGTSSGFGTTVGATTFPDMNDPVDSLVFGATWASTAGTSGNILLYTVERMGA